LARRLDWQRIFTDAAAVTAGFVACVTLGIAIMAILGIWDAFIDIQTFLR